MKKWMTKTKSKIETLKIEAKANKVPIICDEGLAFLISVIKEYNIRNVLEIGAAVGFSAINMAQYVDFVDTFERDEKMCEELYKNIRSFELEKKITVYPYDALEYEGELREYGLIFIDAAKAQYEKFFIKYSPYLSSDGIIVCDNLNFHNLKEDEVGRQTRQLLRKIKAFKEFLANNKEYQTKIFDIGDGMSISKKL